MTRELNEIEKIASQHLGKAGDGSVVKPYVTPDSVDSSLLVGVPRVLNRTTYGLVEDDLPFVGYDRWNCYEFSCLLANGMPVAGILMITYSALSTNIVESKSLKLYLNSFNMERFATMSKRDAIQQACERVHNDLVEVLGTDDISVLFNNANTGQVGIVFGTDTRVGWGANKAVVLEDVVDPANISFESETEDPNILKLSGFDNYGTHWFASSLLRSNCRVTNQPDWGDVLIGIKGKVRPTNESLLQYIVSMRKENHFHEEICECIFKRLNDAFGPEGLYVACFYTRRGGIDINPIRTKGTLDNSLEYLHSPRIIKTARQ